MPNSYNNNQVKRRVQIRDYLAYKSPCARYHESIEVVTGTEILPSPPKHTRLRAYNDLEKIYDLISPLIHNGLRALCECVMFNKITLWISMHSFSVFNFSLKVSFVAKTLASSATRTIRNFKFNFHTNCRYRVLGWPNAKENIFDRKGA